MALAQSAHILQQVSSLSNARGYENAIRQAVDKAPFAALCFRTPWNAPGWESIHEYGRTLADSLGIGYNPRTMAGRYTPTAVLDAGPTYVWSGTGMGGQPQGPYRLPLPNNPDGTPNQGYGEAFVEAAVTQDQYATDVNHLWAFGRLWAEVDFGAQPGDVTRLANGSVRPGNSLAQVVAAHVWLYDIARAALPGRMIEFPLSGHGPASQYINAITDKVVAAGDLKVYFQMNGWQDQGVMWTPATSGDVIDPPPGWCSKPVNRAFQAYDSSPNHNWVKCFDRVEEARDAYDGPVDIGPTYVELYLSTSIMQAPADMISEIINFTEVPDPDPDDELEAALRRIAELEVQVTTLNGTIGGLEAQLVAVREQRDAAELKLDSIREILEEL